MDDTTKELLRKLREVTQAKKEIENEEADLRDQLERRLNSFYADHDRIEVSGMATVSRVPEKVSTSFASKDVLTFASALKAAGNEIGDQLLLLQKPSTRKAHLRIDWEA
jgi:hypothetical protein